MTTTLPLPTAEFVANAMREYARPIEDFSLFLRRTVEVDALPGTDLELRHGCVLWRVKSGALRATCADLNQVVYLALPGDLVGIEPLLGAAQASHTQALVRSTLVRIECGDVANTPTLLREAALQSRRQGIDMLRLRTGQVIERVTLLLTMLNAEVNDACVSNHQLQQTPSLRETANIVGSTPESVCRALSAMRRKNLDPRSRREPRSVTRAERTAAHSSHRLA